MTNVTIRHILAQRTRLIGVGLAILVGVGFLTATLLFGAVLESGFRNAVGAEYRAIDFVLETDEEPFTPQQIDDIEALDGVADVQPGTPFGVEARANGRTASISAVGVPDPGVLRDGLVLESGRLPETAGEIMLLRATARDLRVEVGDRVSLVTPSLAETSTDPKLIDVEVVGLWPGEGRFGSEEVTAFLSARDAARWSGQGWLSTLYVVARPDANLAALETALGEVAGEATVSTAAERVDAEMEEFVDETTIQAIGVGAFGIIALVVAGIVVSNTFAILVAQRTGEIALFRCAGATARQVRGMVLAEAIAVGVLASVAGVTGSLILTNAVLRVVSWRFEVPSLPSSVGASFVAVALPLLAGVAVAVGAAWAPARTAARIDPLQALRIAHAPVEANARPGFIRSGLSLLALLGGLVLLAGGVFISRAGSLQLGVLTGIAGGLGAWLGITMGASVLVPAVVAVFDRIVQRVGGVPARVAASNSRRNPRRTTATTIALVIGVALVTMMSVGAESLKATMFGEIDAQTPWDLEITDAAAGSDQGAFTRFAQSVESLDGVAAQAMHGRMEAEIPGDRPEDVIVFEARVVEAAELADVWRDDRAIAGLGAGVALAPGWVFELAGIASGDTLTVETGGRSRDFRMLEIAGVESMLIAAGDVPTGARPVVDGFWLRLDDAADPEPVLDDIYALADEQGVTIDAGDASGYRQTLTSALDALLLVITALLGVAVLIAVIGVGNTLSLSVVERTRELALLRALGFTRRQLRQSLAVEGLLLAAVGSLIGIVFGTLFGWIGTLTVVGDAWPVALAFPAGRLALVAVVALGCGLVASILPARRAVKAEPVVALAEV